MAEYIMDIAGITGECVTEKYSGMISVKGVALTNDLTPNISTNVDDRATTNEVNLTRDVDGASLPLITKLIDRTTLATVKIYCLKAASLASEAQEAFLTYTLKNARVRKHGFSGPSDHSYPTETLTLSYESIEWEYRQQADDGSLNSTLSASFNLTKSVPFVVSGGGPAVTNADLGGSEDSPSSTSSSPSFIKIAAPGGSYTVIGLEGTERLSQPFEYRVRVSVTAKELSFKTVLGKSATITITHKADKTRELNAIITRVTFLGTDPRTENDVYEFEMRPFLWLLSLAADCKVFQNQSAPDIVEALLKGLGFTDIKRSLTSTYTAREYCVQYRENSLNFVTRLLEEEGIGYFFDHSDSKHTMVLFDNSSAHSDCPNADQLIFRADATSERDNYAITTCKLRGIVTPASYALDSFNFETPSTSLHVSSKASASGTTMSIYDVPNCYTKTEPGEALAKLRLEAYEAQASMLSAEGAFPAFCTGTCFTLSEHERNDVNGKYVLAEIRVKADPLSYLASFDALPHTVPFRPLPSVTKPRVHSAQTALVVGKTGEEIWTDQYGRIKVQFHWDQLGKKDENSSCWVRVSQGWAGKGWGMMFLPRIGQEVIVSFIDGDPDQPLVTGAVYNSAQTVPYALPAQATKSTIKTQTSKEGAGKNNEIRFEDKAQSEEIYIQAQKDYNLVVTNDVTRTIKHNETVTVTNDCKVTINHDNTITIKNDRTRTVSEGNDSLTVSKGTRAVSVKGNETHTNSANFTQSVDGNYKLSVKGNLTLEVTGALSITAQSISMKTSAESVAIQAAQGVTMKAGTSISAEAGASLSMKAGADGSVEAGTTLNLKAGVELTAQATMTTVKGSAMGTVDGGGMLTVKGGIVQIN